MGITRAELVGRMFEYIPASISRWVRSATYAVSEGICVITETTDAWAERYCPITITPEELEKAADLWCTQYAKGHSYVRFDTFAENWLRGDYAAAEYDSNVVDQIVQWGAFGEIRFA